jgi:GT2 family glycosyltransferase
MEAYHRLHNPSLLHCTEFLVITRTESDRPPGIDRVIPYKFGSRECNPAMALNIGLGEAKNENVIITCPEVMPTTPVLAQFSQELGKNVLAQVFEDGIPLVSTTHRSEFPGLYFLAMYNKGEVIEKLNGWDEDFMAGTGWEDTDFGERFKRAGLSYTVRDDIQAIHQKHERNSNPFASVNQSTFNRNNDLRVIRAKNGLVKDK